MNININIGYKCYFVNIRLSTLSSGLGMCLNRTISHSVFSDNSSCFDSIASLDGSRCFHSHTTRRCIVHSLTLLLRLFLWLLEILLWLLVSSLLTIRCEWPSIIKYTHVCILSMRSSSYSNQLSLLIEYIPPMSPGCHPIINS